MPLQPLPMTCINCGKHFDAIADGWYAADRITSDGMVTRLQACSSPCLVKLAQRLVKDEQQRSKVKG